ARLHALLRARMPLRPLPLPAGPAATARRCGAAFPLRAGMNPLDKIARHAPGILYQFRLTPDGSVGHFPYVSERCRALLGVEPEVLMRDGNAMMQAIAQEDRSAVWQSILDSMHRMTEWRSEFRIRDHDGRVRWLLGMSTPQREADGSVLWHGYIQDVSELHEL